MKLRIHEAITQKLIPGMSWAVIEQSSVTTNTLGLSAYPNSPLRNDALYDIASLTKLFTTTRILQLIESGQLSLQDPVKKHLPRFMNESITLEHCLIHRSGLAPSHSGRYTMSKDEMIQSIYDCDDLINPVDTVTNYSCINFLVLGLVIEAVDEELSLSIQHHITEPLHMDDTGFNPKDTTRCVPTEIMETRGCVQGIVHDETAKAFDGVAGNAGLFSTLSDLVKFVNAIMNHTIISKKTLDTLYNYNKEGRSLGWNLFTKHILYHTGFTGPAIAIDLENHRALITLTNRTFPSRIDTGYLAHRDTIIQAFLNKKEVPDSK